MYALHAHTQHSTAHTYAHTHSPEVLPLPWLVALPHPLQELYFYQLRRVEHLRATVPPAELPEALAALAASYRFECAGLAAARNEDCFCVEYIKASGSNKAVLAITLVDRPVTRPAADCLLVGGAA